jgi:hypothetical protein
MRLENSHICQLRTWQCSLVIVTFRVVRPRDPLTELLSTWNSFSELFDRALMDQQTRRT